jgi:hypothetical protein
LLPNRPSLAHQHQKGSLKCIFSILILSQHPPADIPDHRPMAFEETSESRLVALLQKPSQELSVALVADAGQTEKTAYLSQGAS